MARGMTQSELAGSRCTKEYVSQIERGRAKPTAETLAYVAGRLGVDATYLETGQTWNEYHAAEAAIARAEAAIERQDYTEAINCLEGIAYSPEAPELELRSRLAESWARMYVGEVRPAMTLLERARDLSELELFTDVERAEVLYRLGCCRYKLSSIDSARALFTEALALADRSGEPCDRLRSHTLEWRSRCWRRLRDFEAAREDIERALELAAGLDDELTIAHVTFQASIVAERNGHWLRARALAEQARSIYETFNDRQNVGRLQNNLGGLNYLLGNREDAVEHLKKAFAIALDLGHDPDAAQAVSSLAQINLGAGEYEQAEAQARHALRLLDARVDFLDEIGNAGIVLGRALLGQGRFDQADAAFTEAEAALTQLSSASHAAVAWTARGDLASARGDDRAAAALYKRAAEALQDLRF